MTNPKILNNQIREIINDPQRKEILILNKTKWRQLCASLDVISDTESAINSYVSLPAFNAGNGGYLFIYGLLHAFFLQQDAIDHLWFALFEQNIKWKDEYPEVYLLREIRNDAIGHPTKRGNFRSFHFISQPSISKQGFQFISIDSDTNSSEIKDVDLNHLIKTQYQTISIILGNAIELLEKENSIN